MEERERGWTEEGRKEGTTEKERSGGKSDSSGLDFCEGPIRGRGYSYYTLYRGCLAGLEGEFMDYRR